MTNFHWNISKMYYITNSKTASLIKFLINKKKSDIHQKNISFTIG